MSEEASRRVYTSLADLPGIGARKAEWLHEAGIADLSALRHASVDEIAHVRGVGYLLAVRLKELVGDDPDTPPPSATATQRIWVDRAVSLRTEMIDSISELLVEPERRSLSSKFVKELKKVRKRLQELPVDEPPEDGKQRTKLTKHEQALATLVESALSMDPASANYQKALMKRIRSRRKKLEKWL